ncbi:uncharacterized protein DEA37_0008712 [Paragonimus westermani]|uniref:MARVEL domain-containing protein n=1 Tax=Paragonimus westermani TaxID=34504 RepID=A0A5J4N9S2_9TREM|nr:uncharacterized protein DEA37_0008712 [Paragonimus westermani]
MDRVPQTYETTYETRTVEPESSAVVNVAFVKSLGGILKLCEIIISCIVLICVASTNAWSYDSSGGWVNFVAAFTLILAGLFYIFYLFHLIRRLRGPWVIIVRYLIGLVFQFSFRLSGDAFFSAFEPS